MEVSFSTEVEKLRLGDGAIFHGEAILAVTKALLQSGVSYVGGYQGAPVSHLLDVMVQAGDLLDELGVHLETCANEAAAAALLGASIAYPVRGAVTWKSVVGTNVAADGLSNLASAGVTGGALIVVGEDYGEGASVIQERTYAFAEKSSIWLLDPRPDLPTIVDMVEHGFALSEASSSPVMLQLRIRACHLFGSFVAKDNRPAAASRRQPIAEPAAFDYGRLSHPPSTFAHERDKAARRLPAARDYIAAHGLNEVFDGDLAEIGVIVLGGLYNGVVAQLARLGLADRLGGTRVPLLVLNVAYPLLPDQIAAFCRGRRGVLVVEEGAPEYVERSVGAILRGAGVDAAVSGRDVLPAAGELGGEALLGGLAAFMSRHGVAAGAGAALAEAATARRRLAAELIGGALPARPPSFCTGCPERPVFAALKLAQRETGRVHVSADIGCHSLGTLPPFNSGNTILGYGMSLAAAGAVSAVQARRPVSVMGDGGFWHNGLLTGVAGASFNGDDSVLVVLDNGYSSATGAQAIPSSRERRGPGPRLDIVRALRALGVPWVRRVRSYSVRRVTKLLREALTSPAGGLKVVVAEGECQLARQRRVRAADAGRRAAGRPVTRVRYGVDDALCTGDHSCIRLSGCPSLTIKDNPDPLRDAPVAHVDAGCVGCGVCGEVAHAARLCPSFHEITVVENPRWHQRLAERLRRRLAA